MSERREIVEAFIEETFKKYDDIDKSIGILEKAISGLLMELSYTPVDIEEAVTIGAFRGLGEKKYKENQHIINKLAEKIKQQNRLLISYMQEKH